MRGPNSPPPDGALPGDKTDLDNGYLQSLKRVAITEGVDLCGFSIHQGYVSPDADYRKRNVDHTLRCIELAYKLGIPTMRLNTGRWNTGQKRPRPSKATTSSNGIVSPVSTRMRRRKSRSMCIFSTSKSWWRRSSPSGW